MLANERNLGFSGAVNRGIAATAGDVVVLNSDAEVTAGWLAGLVRCRDSDPAIGIVCPLSNHATILSLFGIGQLLVKPDGTADVDTIGACVASAGIRSYPRLPTAVGFCMLLTRELLDRAGTFDPVYGRGYGEENDLSMRASRLGFEIACADDVYVHHAGEASFGALSGVDEARELNRTRLERRWPDYAPSVAAWGKANPLRGALERANAQAERQALPGRIRVLQVLHHYEARGGIEEHTRGVINELRDEIAFNVVVPHFARVGWTDFAVERTATHLRLARMNPDLVQPGIYVIAHAANVSDPGVEAAFSNLLAGGYDVVHFQSLVGWNSLRLPRIARAAGARVVLSCHDLSLACADYNMVLGGEGQPCGRDAAHSADPDCVKCLRSKSAAASTSAPPAIAGYIDERYAAACDAVDAAHSIVCPSEYMAQRMRRAFGTRCDGKLTVVGHGVRDFPLIYEAPDRPLMRVAVMGRFNARKGGEVFLEAVRKLAGSEIAFEVWGQVDGRLAAPARAAGVLLRGMYEADDLPRVLRGIDLVLVPTQMEESFCLVVSEAQRLGIPVAASRIGAIPERVREGETGFLFAPGDPQAIAALLARLHGDRGALQRVAATLRTRRPATIAENARAYLELYRGLVAGDRREANPAAPRPGAPAADVMWHPARRECTPLGTDEYDRWLATEPAASSAQGHEAPALLTLSEDVVAFNRQVADAVTEWVLVREDGDTLAPNAAERMARACTDHPRAHLIYCDDDAISSRGERYDPAFKPGFSAELLRHRPFIAGLCALHRGRFLDAGGLRVAGWAGVVDLALRAAENDETGTVVGLRELLCHRLDVNLGAMEGEGRARQLESVVADHLRRLGKRAARLAAVEDAPAMWAHAPAGNAPIAVLVRAAAAPQRAVAFIESLLQRSGARIAEVFIDLDEARCREIAAAIAPRSALRIASVGVAGQSALGLALRHAHSEWLAVVDARCDLTAGWLERLEQGITGRFAAAIAADVAGPHGERLRGWEMLGGGPWSIAGPPPRLREPSALADLYGAPREVAALSARLALVRCGAARECGGLEDLHLAGEFDMAHLGLAMRKAGYQLLTRPFIAARFSGATSVPTSARVAVAPATPAHVEWMRARWPRAFEDDPFFHPALQLSAERLDPAPRFAALPATPRICAFPFDRWGSGEMRVRQPLAALERAGRARVLVMGEHDSGHAPNRLEWQRLCADVLLAHNFFHDYQLAALEEYARASSALRVLGMDDLLTDLPRDNPFALTIYPDIAERIARAVSLCDRLVVSTQALADTYGGGAKDVRVIPNTLDGERWKGLSNTPRGGARPRVGWAGARQHLGDLRLIETVVEATHRELDWVFLGMCPPSIRPFATEVHDMVPVARYPEKLASLGLDVAVAPLEDNPFNRAKSNLKLLEYGILGIPVVASAVAPYLDSPALVVSARPAEWIEAISALARDLDSLRRRGAEMRRWVLARGMLSGSLDEWSRAFDPAR